MTTLTIEELLETEAIISHSRQPKSSTKPYLAKAFESSKIKNPGDKGFDAMFSFYEMPAGNHLNRAGLTFQETVDLLNEDPKQYHILRGKLMAATFRAHKKPQKRRNATYEAYDDVILAEIDARKHIEQEFFEEYE